MAVGDGGERATTQGRVAQLGVAASIRWAGLVPDAETLLPAFDVVVISSRTEGTPMVLLEAMAAEVPIVSTAVGGIPDVVSDAEALLVPSQDPLALAAAIRQVHDHPDEAKARASRARRRVESTFGVGPWVDEYNAAYAQARADA